MHGGLTTRKKKGGEDDIGFDEKKGRRKADEEAIH
tara:strand:+ start:4216 stop:4320 length:105 start_codon:yes stop_codon:yes gene_type:complete